MKRGFTLIELLAVIVILAIIALIAVPIVLNIINEAKRESQERSIELYASAVKNAVAKYQINNPSEQIDGIFNQKSKGSILEGNIILNVDYDGNVECDNIEIYYEGSMYLSSCKVDGEYVDYTYGEQKEVETAVELCSFTNVGEEGKIGAQYTCNLGETTETKDLVFYVLEEATATKPATLIYEKNYDNTTQAWCASGNNTSCNADGLESKLNEIRSAWTELNDDQIGLPSAEQVATADNRNYLDYPALSKLWLYEQKVTPPYGYWTSTPAGDNMNVWTVSLSGYVGVIYADSVCGVRPVITLNV